MTNAFFEEPEVNSSVEPLLSIVDDGSNSTKFFSDQLSSFNFDGFIPTVTESISVTELQEGMRFSLDGGITFYQIVELQKPDEDFAEFASPEYTIIYSDETKQIQEVTLSSTDTIIATYEDWAEKVLGNTGWLITSQGNAIFSNIAARGRIEATDGFLENLDISGQLNITENGLISIGNITIDEFGITASKDGEETFNLDSDGNLTLTGVISGATISGDVLFESGGIGQIATNEDVESNGGIYMDDTGLYAYNSSGQQTFYIDAETGDVEIFGYASEAETASALSILEDEIDALYEEGFLTDEDLSDTGTTVISGNRITTGVINANLVNISSGLTGLRGVKLNSLGLFAYDSSGQQTFRLNSQTGEVTISGYATDADLENLDYLTEEDIFITGTTNISGNRIRTGVLEGLVYRSNASITRTSGDGVYFDDGGYLRIAKGSSVLSFNGLTGALTIEGYATDGELATASGTLNSALAGKIDDGGAAADVNSNNTSIIGGRIRTGQIESTGYSGGDLFGTSFSSGGMRINLDNGSISSRNFRIDNNGNAEFRGTITSGRGTFTGAAPGTVDGITRWRYYPSFFAWGVAETPTIEVTRNAGLNSTGFISLYRPGSNNQGTSVGMAFFNQGGTSDGDSSSEAVMRGGIEYGSSTADGFEGGGMLRILAMPSKSGTTPGKIKIQAAATSGGRVQLSANNITFRNAKDGTYGPGIQVVDDQSAAMLGIRTTDGVVSLGPRISYGTSPASNATSGWVPGPKNGDLHFQY